MGFCPLMLMLFADLRSPPFPLIGRLHVFGVSGKLYFVERRCKVVYWDKMCLNYALGPRPISDSEIANVLPNTIGTAKTRTFIKLCRIWCVLSEIWPRMRHKDKGHDWWDTTTLISHFWSILVSSTLLTWCNHFVTESNNLAWKPIARSNNKDKWCNLLSSKKAKKGVQFFSFTLFSWLSKLQRLAT